ncbi:putative Amidohydrolase-related domain-containing protein [Seiridium unicorne]|uniref:Amidohydrolase-related domain-containing protein n=1 Tax=Seiridium unicorne TaxID=138068 RepID=A0ABR2UI27_9PEZI
MMSRPLITVHTSTLFDPKKKEFLENVSIKVDPNTGAIVSVDERSSAEVTELGPADIDLREKVVMPGFVDAHTHIFLHDYSECPAAEQHRDESIVERVVRATNHVRTALLAGYTTYRDLGSEAMQSFDANLRDCINRGIIPGPRLFVATHPLGSTGGFEVRTENYHGGTRAPPASDPGDGPEGVRQALRRRVAEGCDIIKFYADYRRKIMRFPPSQQHPYRLGIEFPPADPNPNVPLFSQEEMDMIVKEAQLADLPVAAHAGGLKAALMAVKAGVTSIEHGFEAPDELLELMKSRGCIWVPTLAAAESLNGTMMKNLLAQTKRAHNFGVRMAAGGDTGVFSHGRGAREMELMIEAGIALEDVLEACMLGGWESCGKDQCGYRFGWFEAGNRADIIALETDPREDRYALRKIDFVMKDGKVWKKDGVAVGMVENHFPW